ncbi:hypothetical protein FPV67DRAFT_162435 [Lyophyllum atratum]|nr:hypothetical protein FPV67DRAFT_162435 [Lyophyllum atratum]
MRVYGIPFSSSPSATVLRVFSVLTITPQPLERFPSNPAHSIRLIARSPPICGSMAIRSSISAQCHSQHLRLLPRSTAGPSSLPSILALVTSCQWCPSMLRTAALYPPNDDSRSTPSDSPTAWSRVPTHLFLHVTHTPWFWYRGMSTCTVEDSRSHPAAATNLLRGGTARSLWAPSSFRHPWP